MLPNNEIRVAIAKKFGTQAEFAFALDRDPAIVCGVLNGKRRLSRVMALT